MTLIRCFCLKLIITTLLTSPFLAYSSEPHEDHECQICMDRANDVELICHHSLCRVCYEEISQKSQAKSCPFCRGQLKILEKAPREVAIDHDYVGRSNRTWRHGEDQPTVEEFYSLIRHGRTSKVRQLLPQFDLRTADRHGNSPLHIAAQNGKRKISRILISHGFNVNAQNCKGQTPLHYAITYNYTAVVDLLIAMGAKRGILNAFGLSSSQGISPYK